MSENKYLRNLYGVPDNFGIKRDEVMLQDKNKIDDYKKLVRVLQEDNYKLEAKRAEMKHMIKMQVMSGGNRKGGNVSTKHDANLTPQQQTQVDEFAFKLLLNNSGENDELDPFTL
jgi:hypothetical protein